MTSRHKTGKLACGEGLCEFSLTALIQAACSESEGRDSKKIWLSDTASQALASVVPAPRRLIKASPVTLLKSIKNEVELDGFVNSHARDAAALCSYLCWLDKVMNTTSWSLHNGLITRVQNIDSGSVTEVTGADRLEQFRSEQDHFMGLSFPSISSVTAPRHCSV